MTGLVFLFAICLIIFVGVAIGKTQENIKSIKRTERRALETAKRDRELSKFNSSKRPQGLIGSTATVKIPSTTFTDRGEVFASNRGDDTSDPVDEVHNAPECESLPLVAIDFQAFAKCIGCGGWEHHPFDSVEETEIVRSCYYKCGAKWRERK